MSKRSRVPGSPAAGGGGRVWTQAVRCVRCGVEFLHVELSPDEDEPYGVPVSMRCECGGELVAPRRMVGGWWSRP